MKSSIASALCILTLVLFSFAELLGLYFLSIFRRYRNTKWFQKRFDNLTIFSGYFLQIYLIGIIINIIIYWFPNNYNNDDELCTKWWYHTLEFFYYIINPIPILIITIWAYRCW